MKGRNFFRARDTASKALKLFPNDNAWKQRHKDATTQFREQAKSVGDTPD